ncbi:MAG TPA: hypothetical protein VL947_10050, partial [Cytophagales bacterium]|nr:hypothetical protein [Cytophagales bacterium]
LEEPSNRDSHTDQFKSNLKGNVKTAHISIYHNNKLISSTIEAYDTSGYLTYVKTFGSKGDRVAQYTSLSLLRDKIKVVSKTSSDTEVQDCTYKSDSVVVCITENLKTRKMHTVVKHYNKQGQPKMIHSQTTSNENEEYRRITEKDQLKYYFYNAKNEEDSTCIYNQYINKKVLSYSSKNKYLKYDKMGNCTTYTSKVYIHSSYALQTYQYKIVSSYSYY